MVPYECCSISTRSNKGCGGSILWLTSSYWKASATNWMHSNYLKHVWRSAVVFGSIPKSNFWSIVDAFYSPGWNDRGYIVIVLSDCLSVCYILYMDIFMQRYINVEWSFNQGNYDFMWYIVFMSIKVTFISFGCPFISGSINSRDIDGPRNTSLVNFMVGSTLYFAPQKSNAPSWLKLVRIHITHRNLC